MRALHTAATGMMAQELNVQVISNNIANMRTTGYKRQRAEFQDLLYEHVRRIGTQTSDQGNILPVGVDLGSGVKTVGTPRVMTQGSLSPTGKDFDVAIRGEGFFKIQMPDGTFAYTRDGSFEMDAAGTHRHRAGQSRAAGHHDPAKCQFDHDQPARDAFRSRIPGQTGTQVLGQFTPDALHQQGGPAGHRRQPVHRNAGVRPPQDGVPTVDGMGNLQQGNLEQANVEAVTEISDLIAAQRAYEMNAKVITATDQMLSSTANLMR